MPQNQKEDQKTIRVRMETSMGSIVIELNREKAPLSVANFLRYVDEGFYNDTIFHRVISGFVIQGGGLTKDMTEKITNSPIKNEATNGLKNDRGTIAMARTQIVDSATSQFYINLSDNSALNQRDTSIKGFGYAVFGHVVEGMDVVDKIASVQTVNRKGYQDVPKEPVLIKIIVRL